MSSKELRPNASEPRNEIGVKHTECPLYVKCLNFAVNQKWSHWSCGKCKNHFLAPIYERLQFIEEYYQPLAEIYPEFRKKYGEYIESRHQTST